MKFRYHKFPLPERSEYFGLSVLRPIIPVTIVAGSRELHYEALIDSGADFCIFDAEIGEYLGLPVRAGFREEFGGIQERGGAEAFLHSVVLHIGGVPYTTTVGFSYDIASHGVGLLGQKGFFDLFIVTFDLEKEEIALQEHHRQ